jgi:A/G-specific adenine glycosylase
MKPTENIGACILTPAGWRSLRRWHRMNGRHWLPWRRLRAPWAILVAETLLRRTRAELAARIYNEVLEEFPSPASVIRHPGGWRSRTKTLGLAWRADSFIEACETLTTKYRGQVPPNEIELLSLPGVGHYVARAVMMFCFGRPSILTDANTIRLASRIAGIQLSPARHRSLGVQSVVAKLASSRPPTAADNFALIDLAALICLPATPRCGVCPVVRCCATGRTLGFGRTRRAQGAAGTPERQPAVGQGPS